MKPENYTVFASLDSENRIVSVNSSAYLADHTNWVQIDEGEGDRYQHAQGYYFEGGTLTPDHIPRYRYDGTQIIQRTDEEIEADRTARPASEPTPEDVNAQAIAELSTVIAQNQSVTEDAIAELTIMLAGGAL